MTEKAQQPLLSTASLPWIVTAVAVIGLLYAWTNIRSKNARITALETTEQNNIAKITQLDQSLGLLEKEKNALIAQTDNITRQNDALTADNEQIPGLKKDLSFSRANIARLQHVSGARDNLMARLHADTDRNAGLSQQVAGIPALKKELSFSQAANMRLSHISHARDNLMSQLRETQAMAAESTDRHAELTQQLAAIPAMKTELSHANADNSRLRHISDARNNLMEITQQAKTSNAQLRAQLADLPALKKELSHSRASNMRLSHVSLARDNLIAQIRDNKTDQITAETIVATTDEPTPLPVEVPALSLKTELSYAKAANNRLEHVREARDNLMASLHEANRTNEDLSMKVTSIDSLKKELSLARAANARLTHVSKARDQLQQQLRAITAQQ